MDEVIKLENVVKMAEGNRRTINDVSLIIYKKERVAVLGAPGSGKAALMRLISGMERLSDGKVYVLGKAVHKMGEATAADLRNRHIGLLCGKPAFLDSLTVSENVALPLTIRDVPLAQRQKSAKEQLKALGLIYAANARPSKLSALEARMASLARALIGRPEILLLYDFAAGLPERDTERIKASLRMLIESGGHTILEFTAVKAGLADAKRTVTLEHGKIQEEQ